MSGKELKECVNCPGAEDHSTAQCPPVSEQSKIDAERAAFEEWYAGYACVTDERVKTWRSGDGYREEYAGACSAWEVWQARASLPAGVPDECMVEMAAAAYDRAAHAGATHEQAWHEALSVALHAPAAPTVKAEQVQCRTCNGSRMVDDGEITCSESGIPFENGPVKCVKDCPDCAAPSMPAAGSAVEEVEVVATVCCSKDRDWYIDALHPSRYGENGYLGEGDELMTVAQHQRIVVALSAQQSALPTVNGHKFNCKAVDDYSPGNCSCGADAMEDAPAYSSYTTRPDEAVAGIALHQLGDESRWVEIRDLNAHAFPGIGPHDYYPVDTVLRMPKEQQSAPERVSVQETARLDFMLQKSRKVVCERLPHDNFEVYVEEGFMGDVRYPAVRYSGEWKQGETYALEIQREAIDAALLASHGRGEA